MPLISASTSSPGAFVGWGRTLFSQIRRFFHKTYKSSSPEEGQPLQKPFRLTVSKWSDTGRQRLHNEDSVASVVPKTAQLLARKGALLVIADGMGGHAAGEVASQMAVEAVCKEYYEDEDEDVQASLSYAIKYANSVIYRHSMEHSQYGGMGTTCVVAVVYDKTAFFANVGDSRAYLIHDDQIKQVSQDHSWVAEQIRAGNLSEEQAHEHIMRHMVTRSLGAEDDVPVDLFSEALAEGDTLLLCSDGLSGQISEEEMLATIKHSSLQESAYRLATLANEHGGIDNVTVILARVSFNSF
jgi:serine/threonine protein phosphatase PrpC